jgi:hypothetical protein
MLYPSDGTTREYLLNLMKQLAHEFKNDNEKMREVLSVMEAEVVLLQASLSDLKQSIVRFKDITYLNVKHVQHATMIEPIMALMRCPNDENCEACEHYKCSAWLLANGNIEEESGAK